MSDLTLPAGLGYDAGVSLNPPPAPPTPPHPNNPADNTTTINTKLEEAAGISGSGGPGRRVLLDNRRYYINGLLRIRAGTALEGRRPPGGMTRDPATSRRDFHLAVPALVLGPNGRIRIEQGATLANVTIIRNNVFLPNNFREGITLKTQMQTSGGTAIKIGDGVNPNHDITLKDLLILGFNTAIEARNNVHVGLSPQDLAAKYASYTEKPNLAGNDRLRIENVKIDCWNGIDIDVNYDISKIHDVHCWPFLTANNDTITQNNVLVNINATVREIDIQSVWATAGTTPSTPTSPAVFIETGVNHGLLTGDLVNIYGCANVSANTSAAIFKLTDTQFYLEGIPFSGLNGPQGGKVVVYNNRRGTAFRVRCADLIEFVNCYAYGYYVGFDIGEFCDSPQFHNCSADDLLKLRDPFTRGINISGRASRVKWLGGFISSQGAAMDVNSSASNNGDHQFIGVLVGVANTDPWRYTVWLQNGGLVFTGCDLPGTKIYVRDAMDGLAFMGCDLRGTTYWGDNNGPVTPATWAQIRFAGNRL